MVRPAAHGVSDGVVVGSQRKQRDLGAIGQARRRVGVLLLGVGTVRHHGVAVLLTRGSDRVYGVYGVGGVGRVGFVGAGDYVGANRIIDARHVTDGVAYGVVYHVVVRAGCSATCCVLGTAKQGHSARKDKDASRHTLISISRLRLPDGNLISARASTTSSG